MFSSPCVWCVWRVAVLYGGSVPDGCARPGRSMPGKRRRDVECRHLFTCHWWGKVPKVSKKVCSLSGGEERGGGKRRKEGGE